MYNLGGVEKSILTELIYKDFSIALTTLELDALWVINEVNEINRRVASLEDVQRLGFDDVLSAYLVKRLIKMRLVEEKDGYSLTDEGRRIIEYIEKHITLTEKIVKDDLFLSRLSQSVK